MTPTAVHSPSIVAVQRRLFGLLRVVWIGRCCQYKVERRHQVEVSRALLEHRRAAR